ncbi:MAG: immunity 26/phosphotriesterase HocA family protein [Nocardioides sp.]|uniref:immunity 26/phosphotriesterase HocA family protein n=1 Tax=Nocardioides sp. TaxID=35761 RepID=UPI0039E6D54E
MADVTTNIHVLRPSRKAVKAGDVFAVGLPEASYIFGRVVSTEAQWTLAIGADPAILIYLFRDRSATKVMPDEAVLRPDRLLVSPIMTNRMAWTRGYFETLGNIPLGANDVLPRHCFLSGSRGRYYDDLGNELAGPIEPVGDYALHSFRTIDDQISDALGIPRVPEDT